MSQLAKLAFVATITLLLSACATAPGQKFSGLSAPEKDSSDVYLYRTSAIFAVAQAFDVSLDGNKVGSLYNASFLHLRLAAGKHSLKVSPGGFAKNSELQIQTEPGKQVFLQYDFTTGPLANIFFVGSSIESRNQEQALLDLKELKSAN